MGLLGKLKGILNKDRSNKSGANVASRSNVVVARNVGSEGSSFGARSKQHVTIRQKDGQTSEESETTGTTIQGGE